MLVYILKIAISVAVILVVSEIAKKDTLFGAILASLPLTTILIMCFMYFDTGDNVLIAKFAKSIFWALIPSLFFLACFPLFVKWGLNFYASFGLAVLVMAVGYTGYAFIAKALT